MYGGDVSTLTKVHDEYPNKNLYLTEQSVTGPVSEPLGIAAAVTWVIVGPTRNWSRNALLWNLAADPNNGPHTNDGGCTGCQGAVTLDGNKVDRNLAYYTVGTRLQVCASRFCPDRFNRYGTIGRCRLSYC